MDSWSEIVQKTGRRLYLSAVLKSAVAGLSAFLIIYSFLAGYSQHALLISVLFAFSIVVFFVRWLAVFVNKKTDAIDLIHSNCPWTEYSIGLFDRKSPNTAEQLQLMRLNMALTENGPPVLPFPVVFSNLKSYFFAGLTAVVFFLLTSFFRGGGYSFIKEDGLSQKRQSVRKEIQVPQFTDAGVEILPPSYTGLPGEFSRDLNISAILGSKITWRVFFGRADGVDVRLTNSMGREVKFRKPENGADKGAYMLSDKITGSGLYAIKAYWRDSVIYQSDFYRLEAIADKAPVIDPLSKEIYSFYKPEEGRQLSVSAKVSDDFLVKQVFVVATVARGSGENVKFREARLPVSDKVFKESGLTKTIDLKALDFMPGDELYYYWAAVDNRQPEANFSRSDTYFVVYQDTGAVAATELATMAVNLMPEYFRSQRQIIIDTEKLIAKRKKTDRKAFSSTSNEIGFDQKVLRLRYGQFLGEEFETDIGGGAAEIDPGNVIAAFEHKSDASPEQSFGRSHGEEKEGHEHHAHEKPSENENKDPLLAILELYGHSHDNAEVNTFYEKSTRATLKMALEQMWSSELYLRTFEPEKALPYQQKALEYLKTVQQKSRAYVKKSGFDPPPIKENEKRLSGDLDHLAPTHRQSVEYSQKQIDELVSIVLGFVDYKELSSGQRSRLQLVGNLLSQVIMDGKNARMKDWSVLSSLQKMISGKVLTSQEKIALKASLLSLANRSEQKRGIYRNNEKLEEAFWKAV